MEDRLLSFFDGGQSFSTRELFLLLGDSSLDQRLVFQTLYAMTQGVQPKLCRSNSLWCKPVCLPVNEHADWITLTTRSIIEDERTRALGLAFATMDVASDPNAFVYDPHKDAIARAGDIEPVYYMMSHNNLLCVGAQDRHPGDSFIVKLIAQNPVTYACTPK